MALTHGECVNGGSSLYRRWRAMINRTENPNVKEFKHYGARGISVCEQWKDPFVFFKWAKENGYKEELTIERIDNDGNYCPENCCWTTHSNNVLNRRKSRDFGIHKNGNRFQVALCKNYKVHHGGSFHDIEEAREARDKLYRILHAGSNEVMTKREDPHWEKWEIELLIREYPHKPTKEIAEELGCSVKRIYWRVKRMELKKTKETLSLCSKMKFAQK